MFPICRSVPHPFHRTASLNYGLHDDRLINVAAEALASQALAATEADASESTLCGYYLNSLIDRIIITAARKRYRKHRNCGDGESNGGCSSKQRYRASVLIIYTFSELWARLIDRLHIIAPRLIAIRWHRFQWSAAVGTIFGVLCDIQSI